MYAIGEAARRSGVSIETIRYYEREGVVPLPERSASGRRCYDGGGIARLRLARRCRDLGFPLEDVRVLVALASGDPTACGDVKSIGERHLDDLRARIANLRRLEATLADLVALCSQERRGCPLLHQLLAGGDAWRDPSGLR